MASVLAMLQYARAGRRMGRTRSRRCHFEHALADRGTSAPRLGACCFAPIDFDYMRISVEQNRSYEVLIVNSSVGLVFPLRSSASRLNGITVLQTGALVDRGASQTWTALGSRPVPARPSWYELADSSTKNTTSQIYDIALRETTLVLPALQQHRFAGERPDRSAGGQRARRRLRGHCVFLQRQPGGGGYARAHHFGDNYLTVQSLPSVRRARRPEWRLHGSRTPVASAGSRQSWSRWSRQLASASTRFAPFSEL